MVGTRWPDNTEDADIPPGGYCKITDKLELSPISKPFWYARSPNGDLGTFGRTAHQITEHEDGTITVSPSMHYAGKHWSGWHGWLTKGIWTSC